MANAELADRPVPVGRADDRRAARGARPGCRWWPRRRQRGRKASRFPPSPAAAAPRRARGRAPGHAGRRCRRSAWSTPRGHNLKDVSVAFPVGLLTCVTGVSGSGKSTLVNDTLYAAVARTLYRAHEEPAAARGDRRHRAFRQGHQRRPVADRPHAAQQPGHLHRPVHADPRADGRDDHGAERGYGPGRFSFNVAGGRCEACQGDGVVKVEMHFLPDVYVPCDVCHGQRYNRETLEVQYKGSNIAQILDMTVEDAHRVLQGRAHHRAQAADAAGRGPDATSSSARPRPRCRAARRSASSWRWNCPSATPAARSTSWTSRPPACTSPTSTCC